MCILNFACPGFESIYKIEERRIAKLMSAEKEERSAETTKKESSKNYTPKPSSLKKVVVISP